MGNRIQTGRPGNLRPRDETAAAQGPLAQLSEDQLLKFAQDVTGKSFGGEKSIDFAQLESTRQISARHFQTRSRFVSNECVISLRKRISVLMRRGD